MALPYGATGSLTPTFVPARLVGLAVKPPYVFTLGAWFPIRLRGPSRASVTFWEATAPVKLPTRQCPPPGSRVQVRLPKLSGWFFILPLHKDRSPCFKASHLDYANNFVNQCQAVVKVHGVFPSCRG